MNSQDELRNLIARHGLQRFGTEIENSILPAIHIRKQARTEAVVPERRFFGLLPGSQKQVQVAAPLCSGASHFGGRPDVGPDFKWPQWNGKALGFLAQINCAEAAALDSDNLWPKSGSLCFFHAIADCPWGDDPDFARSWAVIHVKNDALRLAELPAGLTAADLLPAFPISLRRFSTLPDALSGEVSDAEFDSYYELCSELRMVDGRFEPAHQTLGHVDSIQGPVEEEWQEFQTKLGRPHDDSDWKLLLQFDSDDDLNVMWGDAGMLYFGIRESAFRAQRFEETLLTWQCC